MLHCTLRVRAQMQGAGNAGWNSRNRLKQLLLVKAAAVSAGALSDADRGLTRGNRRAYASSQW